MDVLLPVTIFVLAVSILIVALIVSSAIKAAFTSYRQIPAEQQEALAKTSKAFETIAESVHSVQLEVMDYNNFGQFNKLVSAIEDCRDYLKTLYTPPPDNDKGK